MMRNGKMPNSGDVVLATIQFTDSFEIKKRPAVVLYKDFNNIVVAGITSNPEMRGIPLRKKEGAVKDSVVKLNYIFTISDAMIKKILFPLSSDKKSKVYDGLVEHLKELKEA